MGWGKASAYEPMVDYPFDLADSVRAAEEFRAKILRLADGIDADDA
jgi:hypothetical protein